MNEASSETVTVTVNGESTAPDVKVITYDKAIYDQTNSATPVWAPPSKTVTGLALCSTAPQADAVEHERGADPVT